MFERVLGKGGVITDPVDLVPYNRDWTGKYIGNSPVVLRPSEEGQVSEIMRICHAERIALVPQGGNTGLVGGSVPNNDDQVILSLGRLDRIHGKVEDGVISCQAGCILENLEAHVAEQGYTIPLNLGAKGSCQIGGNLATNAAGSRFIRWGSLRSNCLGMRVVLADGTVLDLSNRMQKDNTGLDLKQLFIGSEGSLGIITACNLLTPPKPTDWNVVLLKLQGFDSLVHWTRMAKQRLSSISALEFWDCQAAKLLNKMPFELNQPDEFALLIETASCNGETDSQQLLQLLGDDAEGVMAQDEGQRADFWSLRESIPEAAAHQGTVVKYDLTLLLPSLYELVEDCRQRLPSNILVTGYGHAGDGNLHLNVITRGDPIQIRKLLEPWIWERVRKDGGSISAEHGIGQMKVPYLHYAKSPEAIAMMRSFKDLLDPQGILNPGKLLSNAK